MSSAGALQPQWNLDRTVSKSLDVALEFVRIATRDNVQVIALMACERFGVTLPICRATRSAVEKKTKLKQEPLLLRFAKAMISKAGGETLEKLSSNVAGLNFLALAAAIVPTMTLEESGAAIQQMLDTSAIDKTLVPPEHHVQAILEVLGPQLHQIGFIDKVCEWDLWLNNHVRPFYDTGTKYPSPACMNKVVSALRSLARIGNEKIDNIVITCYSCTAWIIAFVEWCMETPPSLCSVSGSAFLPQPDSKIIILIPTEHRPVEPNKVELFQASDSLYDTVYIHPAQNFDDQPQIICGMVSAQVHAQLTLQAFGTDPQLGLRPVLEALLYALPQIKRLLIPLGWDSISLDGQTFSQEFRTIEDTQTCVAQFSNCFPEATVIYSTMCKYLGPYMRNTAGFKQLPKGTTGNHFVYLNSIL